MLLNIKVYSKKEADDIIKKHPDRALTKKQFVVDLVENTDTPGTYKTKRGYIIVEWVKYKTADNYWNGITTIHTTGNEICGKLFVEE